MSAGNLIIRFLDFVVGAEASFFHSDGPRSPDADCNEAETSRARRQAYLDLMDAHPDAFVSEESFRTALCYFSHRV